MRMRKRHNLEPRMEQCRAVLIENPEEFHGEWLRRFPKFRRVQLEIGCGKGRFTTQTAAALPDTLLVAIEKVPDAMVLAMERALREGLDNIRFLDFDAARLPALFAPGEAERIYINFCDPWPKSRDAKFRLTSPGFLRLYADALPLGGQIWFKTDNGPLFDWSLEQFQAEGWTVSELTRDLHAAGPVGVMTDYEAKFVEQGVKIHRLVATREAGTKTTAAGPVPRLRNAALPDSAGYERSVSRGAAVSLAPATRELCRAYYRKFVHDPDLFEDPTKLVPYEYDEAAADAYFYEKQQPDRRNFYILLRGEVIGALVLKHIDAENKCCEMGVCLVNDSYKNRGFGTEAERQGLAHAFGELGLNEVRADTLLRNTRSQRVLQKLGFRFLSEDEHFKYYRITKEEFEALNAPES